MNSTPFYWLCQAQITPLKMHLTNGYLKRSIRAMKPAKMFITPLESARRKRGLTQTMLGEAVGTDSGNISRMECLLQGTSPEMAERLARILGISEMKLIYPERYLKDRK